MLILMRSCVLLKAAAYYLVKVLWIYLGVIMIFWTSPIKSYHADKLDCKAEKISKCCYFIGAMNAFIACAGERLSWYRYVYTSWWLLFTKQNTYTILLCVCSTLVIPIWTIQIPIMSMHIQSLLEDAWKLVMQIFRPCSGCCPRMYHVRSTIIKVTGCRA